MLVLAFVLLGGLAIAATPKQPKQPKKNAQSVPEQYREWLNRDVAYIITNEEKKAFINLSTNDERDKFIERFWEVRNPTPGSPSNPYKDEIYKRLAYTEQWFGGKNGWRSDRGRVYITLGPPKQVGRYLSFANIRPMEIWFYSNDHPALPPFFYVVFYQKDAGDDFRLYSPFMDGPDKLVTGASGNSENNRVGSWQIIDHDAGREVSRTTLSLLPDEPVDYQTATSSMASDMMLNNIRGLANHPLNKEILRQRRTLLENVSHRVILGSEYLDVLTVPLIDESGDTNVHYVLRLKKPEDFSLAESKEGTYYYTASVSAKVLTADAKQIFSQERKLSQYVDDKQLVKLKNRVFGYEGLLPLAPGKYKLKFQLTDEIKHTSFTADRDVVVPERPTSELRITEVVPFSEAASGQPSFMPFSAGGVRFTPAMEGLTLVPGQDLEFFYQLWAPASDPNEGELEVEYAYGRMGMNDIQTLKEQIARNQFDAHGAMISGKKIPTAALAPGNYRLAITVTDPLTHKRSVAGFQFRIADLGASAPTWDISDPQAAEDVRTGRRQYERALCYIFQGDQKAALSYLQNSYSRNPDEQTREKLVDVLYSRQAFAEIGDLYSRTGITPRTDEDTIVKMAESLNRLGEVTKSIQLLESALSVRQASSTLYLSLAHYYQVAGNNAKASEMEEKAKAIAAHPTT